MTSIVTILGLGACAAAANLFGGAILVQHNWERRYLKYFMALGAGFMLSTAILEMLPASLRLGHHYAIFLVLGGYLLIHFCEHTISPHFHFGEETHTDEFDHGHHHHRRSFSVLLGLLIHTFFDGIAIASGFLVSNALGWLVFIAIFLHKIPEGFTITSVFLASGSTRLRSWATSAMLGASTFAGVLLMTLTRNGVEMGLPFAAGVTLYVAASDLIPEVNREPGARMPIWVFAGVAAQILLDHLMGG
jgi:ZIP family zinc transporter/zinc and cadmium transporter